MRHDSNNNSTITTLVTEKINNNISNNTNKIIILLIITWLFGWSDEKLKKLSCKENRVVKTLYKLSFMIKFILKMNN